MKVKPFRVSDINAYIKNILSRDPILSNLQVEGEISNFKWHSSGHLYFSLKDDKGLLKTVMFRQHTSNILIQPEEGMKVIVGGYISVYERDGSYRLYANSIVPTGQGELYLKYEELKRKLEEKGYFDIEHKKILPKYPAKVGVITSPTGAAVRDIISVIKRRMPFAQIIIYPALVQGIYATDDLCKGIEKLDSRKDIDVIIIGRGGGSIEELWSFNDEKLAKKIYKASTPIVSAVGHETDFTICDFVSDLRVPTPSVAGEVVVPDILVEFKENEYLKTRLNQGISNKINIEKSKLEKHSMKSIQNQISKNLKNEKQLLNNIQIQLNRSISKHLDFEQEKVKNLGGVLDAYSPLKTLNRGYSIVETKENHVLKSIEDILIGDLIKININDGQIKAVVNEVMAENK